MNASASELTVAIPGGWPRPAGSGWRETIRAAVLGVLITIPMVGVGVAMWVSEARALYRIRHPLAVLLHEPPKPTIHPREFIAGREVFRSVCAACHGADARGVAGLGKSLLSSDFAAGLSDRQLAAFLAEGRPADHPLNTTRVAMPPRGGNDALTDEDLASIVAYLRGLQDPRRAPAVSAEEEATILASLPRREPSAATPDLAALTGATGEEAEWLAWGRKQFASSCTACHGADAKGMQGLGKDLIASDFVRGLDEEGLVEFLKKGRSTSDPLNTTKVDMPPKGGNPALDDDDLYAIALYVRSLQQVSMN